MTGRSQGMAGVPRRFLGRVKTFNGGVSAGRLRQAPRIQVPLRVDHFKPAKHMNVTVNGPLFMV